MELIAYYEEIRFKKLQPWTIPFGKWTVSVYQEIVDIK
jgi:hypothetical protein